MYYPICIMMPSLWMAYYWNSLTVSGCQICIRNFLVTPPLLGSSQLSTASFELPEISVAYLKSDNSFRQQSLGCWLPHSSLYQRNRRPRLFVTFYEGVDENRDSRFSNDDMARSQSEKNSTFSGTHVLTEINGTNCDTSDVVENATHESDEENSMSIAMISTIGFYKRIISPLLPPACRFVPTCSSYGVQAIQEFGPTKGCVLIAWRILRCSPFGGKGYDPPKWPPVSYTYSSY